MKIKEKILKLGKRKNCFISLLLCALLLFAIVGSLNGSKSAKTEVNALSAPTTKNLDLNGVRYTYQTSLSELQSDYNILTHWAFENFIIKEDSEGVTELYIGNMLTSGTYSDEDFTKAQEIIKDSISIEYDNILIESVITTNEDKNVQNTIFEFANSPSQTNMTGIKINYNTLLTSPYVEENVKRQALDYINVIYVNKNNASEYIVYTYVNLLKSPEIYFKFKNIKDYNVMGIIGLRNDNYDEVNIDNQLYGQGFPNDNFAVSNIMSSTIEANYAISELDFNVNDNYICFKNIYNEDNQYLGNILLSNNKFDVQLFNYLTDTIPRKPLQLTFNGPATFGGNFEFYSPINTLFYTPVEDRINGFFVAAFNNYDANNLNWKNSYFYKLLNNNNINYLNQNRLLYLSKAETLRIEENNNTYDALSAQVEDILYNVEYVGDIEEVEYNEKVEEDFENLVKLVGLGAFIGLLAGILFGVPGLGALIGALIGLGAGLIPLIIDALQSIFGHNFLSGLYNFFKSITNFFVNIVDTVINFLLSIITNPFVLVLILIIVLLYIFVIRPKIK